MIRTRDRLWVFAILCCMVVQTGCLRTRAQLRGDSEDTDPSIPVHAVQEVRADSRLVVEELKDEVTRIQGRIEDLERSQQEMIKKVNAANSAQEVIRVIEPRIAQLEQKIGILNEEIQKIQAKNVNPEDYLAEAKARIKVSDHAKAIEALDSYLKSPKAKKVETATLMRAETYFKMKEYKKAIVDYSRFPEKYRNSSSMPQALHKIGLCFDALGMKDDAKGFYQELLEKFPKSPEAKLVKKKVK